MHRLREKITLLSLVIIYKGLLDYIYIYIVNPQFSYMGFFYDFSVTDIALSWGTLIGSYFIMYPILNDRMQRFTSIVFMIMYFMFFVPYTVCIGTGVMTGENILYSNLYWLFFTIFAYISLKKKVYPFKQISFNRKLVNKEMLIALTIISAGAVLFVSGFYSGFRINLNLFDVYDIRSESKGYAINPLLTYVLAWTKALLPVLFSYFIIKRNILLSIVMAVVQILSFGIDGVKMILFMMLLAGIISFVKEVKLYKRLTIKILYLMIAISIISILEYLVFNTSYITSFIIRRMYFYPVIISQHYYDFFSVNEPDYFRSTLLQRFGFVSPYVSDGQQIGEFIGSFYFQGINYNDGLTADAITNLGWVGLVVMPFLLTMLLYLFDRISIGLDKRILLISSIYIAVILISTFLTTAILTHGMLVLFFLLLILRKKKCV